MGGNTQFAAGTDSLYNPFALKRRLRDMTVGEGTADKMFSCSPGAYCIEDTL